MKLSDSQIQYFDRADVTETFVNSLGKCFFTEGVANIELCVTRNYKP